LLAINVRDIKVDVSSFGDSFILTDVVPVYVYTDNKRTDVIEAYRYVVAIPSMKFEKMGVKIMGNNPLFELEDGETKNVKFDDLDISLYQDCRTKAVGVSAEANGIHEI